MQIITMQFMYYTTLSVSIVIINNILYGGLRSHLGQLFSPSSLDLSLDYSMATLLANFLNIPFVICALAYTVEKANKCLDFTVTIFFLHWVLTCLLFKFPTSLSWWLYHAVLITITVLASEYVCLKLETAEIKFSFGHIIENGVKSAQDMISKTKKTGTNNKKQASQSGKKKDKIEDV